VLDQNPPPGSLAAPGGAVNLIISAEGSVEAPRAKVPQVTGIPFDKAANALNEAGFEVDRTGRRVGASAQVGIVLAQKPRAGSTAEAGTTVVLVVGVRAPTPERPEIDRSVARVAELAQAELIERRVFPADEPRGAFARRLEKAGVRTLDDVDQLLTFDRRELRQMLRLRTLAQTDQTIRALKRARDRIGD
jgi:hypothetical protein